MEQIRPLGQSTIAAVLTALLIGFLMLWVSGPAKAAATRVTFGNVSQPITGTVTPSNTASTPLFVTHSDDRNGVGAQCDARADDTGNAICTMALIPPGKTLVITTLNCWASVPNGYPFSGLLLIVGATPIGGGAPTTINHFLHLSLAATDSIAQQYRLTTPVKIYAPGGSNGGSLPLMVQGNVGIPGALSPGMGCALAGYMVDQ